jgi:general secretion pathway protein J
MLVALAILALLSALLVQGFGVGQHYWRGAVARTAVAEAIDGAQNNLRYRLERMYFETRHDASPPYPGFGGTDSTMTFTAPPPESRSPGSLRQYMLSVSTAGDLVLTSRSDLWGYVPERMSGQRLSETLLHGVESIELAYFDSGPDGGWLTVWRHRPAPPALVRIRVNFPPGDGRWWPDLIIRPLADIDADCIRSMETKRCAGRL